MKSSTQDASPHSTVPSAWCNKIKQELLQQHTKLLIVSCTKSSKLHEISLA